MNQDPAPRHPDLERLLAQVPPGEADRLRAVWALAGEPDADGAREPAGAAQAWDRLEAAIDHAGRPRAAPDPGRRAGRAPRRRTGSRTVSIAALAAAALLAGLALTWWLQPVHRTAAPGERLTLTLPDGSSVELNSGSVLRHARRFGAERVVELQGEAFFEVTDDARPFVVSTFNAEVRVLGTRFNVRARPEAPVPRTTVSLESGRVELAPAGRPERRAVLAPGDTRHVDASGLSGPVDLSVADAEAWRRGDLVFKDEPLGVVLDEVERRFAVDLLVEPPAVRQRRLTTALRQPANAESVVRDLAVTLGLRYRATATGFELYGRRDDAQAL